MAPTLKYAADQMRKALKAVKEDGISVRSASIKYNVPRTTLSDKLKNKVPKERKMGPETVLSVIEEEQLIRWIITLGKAGFPVTKDQLLDSVKMLITKVKRETPFTNNRPGRHWYQAFMRRHPEISTRAPQNLSRARALVTEENIRNWFKEIQLYYIENNFTDVITNPRRIFNCDETAFFLSPKGNRVLVQKGEKAVYNFINSNEKESITTLMTGNAAGELAPLMIMISCKRMLASVAAAMPESWGLGKSDNGWMTAESFYEFVANIFHPWLLDKKISLPVVLYVDGHTSHITMALSDFCSINQIILVALYPNSTHILQPMDVAMFHPLKQAWKNVIHGWRMEHNAAVLKRETFPPLLKKAIDSIDSAKNLQNGFQTCGLFPFDSDAVNYSKLLKTDTQRSAGDGIYDEELHRAKEHLRYFESQQSSEKIETFEKSGDTWNGLAEDLNLFNYWISLKRKAGEKDNVLSLRERTNEILNIYNNDACSNVQSNTTVSALIINDNTMNLQNNISNLDQDIDTFVIDGVEVFESLNHEDVRVIDIFNSEETNCENNNIVQCLNMEKNRVYDRATSCNNSEGSEDSAQEIGVAHNEYSPSPIAARQINIATNYTEGYANEVADGATHPVISPSIEHVTREIEDGQKDNLEFPIDTSDIDITQKTKDTISSISSVFKGTLFWPTTLQEANSKKTNNVRRRKEKVPAVVSSLKWKEYYKEKENKKQEILMQKEERKRKREEKAKEALELKKRKQEAKDKKQRIAKEAKKAQKVQKAPKKTARKIAQKK